MSVSGVWVNNVTRRVSVFLFLIVVLAACTPTGSENLYLQLKREDTGTALYRVDCASSARELLCVTEGRGGAAFTDGDTTWLADVRDGFVCFHRWRRGTVIERMTDIPCYPNGLLWVDCGRDGLVLDTETWSEMDRSIRRVVVYDWAAGHWRSLFTSEWSGSPLYCGYTLSTISDDRLYVSDPQENVTWRISLADGSRELAADVGLCSPYLWNGKLYGFGGEPRDDFGGRPLPKSAGQQPEVSTAELLCCDCNTGAVAGTGLRIPWAPLYHDAVACDGGYLYLLAERGDDLRPWSQITRYDLETGAAEVIPTIFPEDGLIYADFSGITVCGEYLAFRVGQGEEAKLPSRRLHWAEGWAMVPLGGGEVRLLNCETQ